MQAVHEELCGELWLEFIQRIVVVNAAGEPYAFQIGFQCLKFRILSITFVIRVDCL